MFSLFKYGLPLALAALLLWWVMKDVNFDRLWSDIHQAKISFILYSFFLFVASNIIRAYRWNLLIKPMGYKLHLGKTFLAVMSMYFANLIVPRLGEVTRCGIMQRTQGVPVSKSLGTVVAERLLDVVTLFVIIGIALLIQFDLLGSFFGDFFAQRFKGFRDNISLIIMLGISGIAVMIVVVLLVRRYRTTINQHPVIRKIVTFLEDLGKGFTGIARVKQPVAFAFSTVLLWVCYYMMSYVIFYALPATRELGFEAGLTVLVLGGLGMSAPVQGGFGAFHFLVQSGLILYNIAPEDGITYATLVHSSQAIFVLIFGGLAMLIGFVMGVDPKNVKPEDATSEE